MHTVHIQRLFLRLPSQLQILQNKDVWYWKLRILSDDQQGNMRSYTTLKSFFQVNSLMKQMPDIRKTIRDLKFQLKD